MKTTRRSKKDYRSELRDCIKTELPKLIKLSGLKKGFICEKVGIHRSYLSFILNGTRIPSQKIVDKILKIITVKP